MYCKIRLCHRCRDNYDKEMKEKSGHRQKFFSKSKKPDQQTYVIPSARANCDSCEYLVHNFHSSYRLIIVMYVIAYILDIVCNIMYVAVGATC